MGMQFVPFNQQPQAFGFPQQQFGFGAQPQFGQPQFGQAGLAVPQQGFGFGQPQFAQPQFAPQTFAPPQPQGGGLLNGFGGINVNPQINPNIAPNIIVNVTPQFSLGGQSGLGAPQQPIPQGIPQGFPPQASIVPPQPQFAQSIPPQPGIFAPPQPDQSGGMLGQLMQVMMQMLTMMMSLFGGLLGGGQPQPQPQPLPGPAPQPDQGGYPTGGAGSGNGGSAGTGGAGNGQAGSAGTGGAGSGGAGTAADQTGGAGSGNGGSAGTGGAGSGNGGSAGTGGAGNNYGNPPAYNPPPAANPYDVEPEPPQYYDNGYNPYDNYDTPAYDGGDGGYAQGDPHFRDFDKKTEGHSFDFMGQAGKTYSIVSDKNLQLNARFDEWSGPDATIMSEIGVQIANPNNPNQVDQIHFDGRNDDRSVATSAPTINGVELKAGEEVQLADGGTAVWDGSNKLTIKSAEYTFDVSRQDSAHGGYLNIDSKITDGANPFGDLVAAHGLLGQTADGDGQERTGDRGKGAQGGGAIEIITDQGEIKMSETGNTDTNDYETNGLFGTSNNAFNRFGVEIGNVRTNAQGQVIQVLGTDGTVLFGQR